MGTAAPGVKQMDSVARRLPARPPADSPALETGGRERRLDPPSRGASASLREHWPALCRVQWAEEASSWKSG